MQTPAPPTKEADYVECTTTAQDSARGQRSNAPRSSGQLSVVSSATPVCGRYAPSRARSHHLPDRPANRGSPGAPVNLTAQAHELHRSGFSVLAMDSEKRPVVRTWKHFKQRAQSPHEITRMFAHPRATSVAIILPDGTVHVEADTAEGTQHIEAHGIPRGTPVLDSPRGIHCTWAGALSGPGVKAESGLDALGAG